VIQEPAVKPPTITPKAAAPIPGPDGFLTVESLKTLVFQSGLLHGGEDVKKELLIFQTPRQRTWLLATDNFVFVLLDDEGTRSSKSVIQTFFEKKKTFPLKFGSDKKRGLVLSYSEQRTLDGTTASSSSTRPLACRKQWRGL
jgi:hypothetical protein